MYVYIHVKCYIYTYVNICHYHHFPNLKGNNKCTYIYIYIYFDLYLYRFHRRCMMDETCIEMLGLPNPNLHNVYIYIYLSLSLHGHPEGSAIEHCFETKTNRSMQTSVFTTVCHSIDFCSLWGLRARGLDDRVRKNKLIFSLNG